MKHLIDRHDVILRTSIEQNDGIIFKTLGDGFCASFSSVGHAASAALNIQIAIQAEQWGAERISVRTAVHTGRVTNVGDDYHGTALVKLARMISYCNGGQILLSEAARTIGFGDMPHDSELIDMGTVELRGFKTTEHIYQLFFPGLPTFTASETLPPEPEPENSTNDGGYDVFISFKNLDENGIRTKDVVIAECVAETLRSQNLSVFFSLDSLETKGTSAYRQAIDDALDEAAILVAVGTSKGYLSEKWVRYEWDTFTQDIISGLKPYGRVFTVIDGMSVNELPRGLRHYQSFGSTETELQRLSNFINNASH